MIATDLNCDNSVNWSSDDNMLTEISFSIADFLTMYLLRVEATRELNAVGLVVNRWTVVHMYVYNTSSPNSSHGIYACLATYEQSCQLHLNTVWDVHCDLSRSLILHVEHALYHKL